MEIDYGDFQRTLYIPFPLKTDEIRAVYRQGFLDGHHSEEERDRGQGRGGEYPMKMNPEKLEEEIELIIPEEGAGG